MAEKESAPARNVWRPWLAGLLVSFFGGGCATHRAVGTAARAFDFSRDTFAFANETLWRYELDPATGRQVTTPRDPVPVYTLHCFVLARAAKQFFLHARFAPELPPPDDETCRRLIRRVMLRSPQRGSAEENKTVIPGYAGLRAFSTAHEDVLKAGCGGAWRSYFQRGNWRMVFPVSRRHQENAAREFLASTHANHPAVIHIFRFPQLTINHTLLIFAAEESEGRIEFIAYDPNIPEQPVRLIYERATRTFQLPATHYFIGGQVDAYEIYRGWFF